MSESLRTALIGCGRIASTYSEDPLFKKEFKYAVHAEVLNDHPLFNWGAVVDSNPENLKATSIKWGIENCYSSAEQLLAEYQPEVIVLATKPEVRFEIIEKAEHLKAVLCEKPLGNNLNDAKHFVRFCEEKNILLQTAYIRRGDTFLNSLKDGGLERAIGKVQFVNAAYGNGLTNNGSHTIDLIRMLLGEIEYAKLLDKTPVDTQCPLEGDHSYPFFLKTSTGIPVTVQAFDFACYREIFWDFWGTTGRMTISQEGLLNQSFDIAPHRALSGAMECKSDRASTIKHTHGTAFYGLYENLAATILGQDSLCSSGRNAMATESLIEDLKKQITGA